MNLLDEIREILYALSLYTIPFGLGVLVLVLLYAILFSCGGEKGVPYW